MDTSNRWWWPDTTFGRLCIVGLPAVCLAWFGTAQLEHRRGAQTEAPFALACQQFVLCEVCVNKDGDEVCGESRSRSADFSARAAWFKACLAATGMSPADELPSFGALMKDPCVIDDGLFAQMSDGVDPTGFMRPNEAERACYGSFVRRVKDVGARAVPIPDPAVLGAAADAWANATKQLRAVRRINETSAWRTCVAKYPRARIDCSPAASYPYADPMQSTLPQEVLDYGKDR